MRVDVQAPASHYQMGSSVGQTDSPAVEPQLLPPAESEPLVWLIRVIDSLAVASAA
jgi:hypothetical protein